MGAVERAVLCNHDPLNSTCAQVNDLEDAIEQLKAATAVAADAADADLASNAARVYMFSCLHVRNHCEFRFLSTHSHLEPSKWVSVAQWDFDKSSAARPCHKHRKAGF